MRWQRVGMAALAVGLCGGLSAQAATLDQLDGELTALAARVAKSVVTIASEPGAVLKPGGVPGLDLRVVSRRTTASGVIYDTAGHIVTVASSVGRGRTVKVTLPGGATVDAAVVGRDPASNIAVLKVEAEGLTPAAWGASADLKPGSLVVAVGSSFGMGPSVTLGVVSAVGRSVGGHADLIQVTAPINPGDSGGMLANTKGELVGIITATFGRAPSGEWLDDFLNRMRRQWPSVPLPRPDWFERFEPGGSLDRWREQFEDRLKPWERDFQKGLPRARVRLQRDGPGRVVVDARQIARDVRTHVTISPPVHIGSQGMNYALPADAVKTVVEQLIRHGKVSRGWLGVMMEARTDDQPGLVVAGVLPDSPAAKAGLKVGDRLLAVGDVKINSFAQLARTVARRAPGSTVTLRVRRGDETLTPTVTLTERPVTAEPTPGDVEVEVVPEPMPPVGRPLLGIQFQPLTEDLARHLGVKEGHGVLVAAVAPGSPAEEGGVRVGDCIVAVEKEPVAGEDLRALLGKHAGKTVTLDVIRDRKPIILKVALPARAEPSRTEQLERTIRRLQKELERLKKSRSE